MSENKLDPAYPQKVYSGGRYVDCYAGMSKRLLLAGMAMQGILARQESIGVELENICKMSFMASDELLKQENL